MSLYASNSGAREGEYNEEIGIDIDGATVSAAPDGRGSYYDYDLLTRPSVSGSGIIIPPADDGFPKRSDYTNEADQNRQFFNADGTLKRREDGMADAFRLKSSVEDDQSASLDTQIGDVNNGRMSDIKVVQDTIRYKVHQNTQQVISEQSSNDLFIIMRSIMLQFANFRIGVDNIVDEVRRLNAKVVEYSVENISSNVKQHQGYIEDISKLPTPMDMPVYHNKKNFTYDISNLL